MRTLRNAVSRNKTVTVWNQPEALAYLSGAYLQDWTPTDQRNACLLQQTPSSVLTAQCTHAGSNQKPNMLTIRGKMIACYIHPVQYSTWRQLSLTSKLAHGHQPPGTYCITSLTENSEMGEMISSPTVHPHTHTTPEEPTVHPHTHTTPEEPFPEEDKMGCLVVLLFCSLVFADRVSPNRWGCL